MFFIVEMSVDFDDVGMIEEGLDFELSDELSQKVVLNDAFLLNNLQSDNHSSLHLPRQVHAAELTLSQLFNHLKMLLAHPLFPRQLELRRRLRLASQK